MNYAWYDPREDDTDAEFDQKLLPREADMFDEKVQDAESAVINTIDKLSRSLCSSTPASREGYIADAIHYLATAIGMHARANPSFMGALVRNWQRKADHLPEPYHHLLQLAPGRREPAAELTAQLERLYRSIQEARERFRKFEQEGGTPDLIHRMGTDMFVLDKSIRGILGKPDND